MLLAETCPGPAILRNICQMRGIKIAHLNVQGLATSFNGLCDLLGSNPEIDILTLSETHLSKNTYNDHLYYISGYTFVKRNRTKGKGGGVAMYLKNGLNWKRRKDLDHESVESIVVEVIIQKAKNILITTVYRPPNGSKYLQNNFTEHFNDLLSNKKSKEIIILGDLNINYLKRNDNEDIKHLLTLNGFSQMVDKPTRITKESSTLIDIIATNKSENIVITDVIPVSLSDHDMIICVRKINNLKYKARYIKTRNYTRYDPVKLQSDLKAVDWTPVLQCIEVNRALKYFTEILSCVFNKHAPYVNKRVKGKPAPWIDRDIHADMDKRDMVLRKARKSNNEKDWKLYRKLRNYCTNRLRTARKKHHQQLLEQNRINPRKFWQTIKNIFPSKLKRSTSFDNSKEKAQSFSEYFATAVTKLKATCYRLRDLTWKLPKYFPVRTKSVFKFQYISVLFVRKELKALNRNKATGLDDLPPGLLKDSANEICKPLAHIINLSIDSSTVPDAWKIAKVIPVYKSGDINDEANYRPISILPTLSKILERAVYKQLIEYLEDNKLLTNQQYGYRKKRSTEHAATIFTDDIRRQIEQGKLVGAVFMDLRRAFDTIGHSTLMTKLKSYGICGKEIVWFNNYMFYRRQTVEIGANLSPEKPVLTGVPQGSLLGPLLFIVYFNDISDYLTKANSIMYADDMVIYYADKDVKTIEKCLNNELMDIANYLDDSELIINLKKGKTESMLLGTAKRLAKIEKDLKVSFRDTVINGTNSYVYLGNVINPSLNLNKSFQTRYKKASARVRLLCKVRPYLTKDAAEKVFLTMIVPLLTYCGNLKIILTQSQESALSSIEARATRLIYGANTTKRVPSIVKLLKEKACLAVRKCLDNETCSPFKNYFEINHHGQSTRNQNNLLKLPKLKLEIGRQTFHYSGAKLYNSLPLHVRKTQSLSDFKIALKSLEF